MMQPGVLWDTHKARKEFPCAAGFTCTHGEGDKATIKPGEKYFDEVAPPWLLTQDDPDGAPFKLGEWIHARFHVECYGGLYQ